MSVRSLVSVDDHLVLRVTLAILASLVAPLAAAQSAPSTSSGQSYPSKTIRIIASQAPGGGIDTVCRIVAPKLSDAFGQNVIVDNRPGANGSLAAEVTAKSPSDGHTLMLGAVGNLSTNVLFYKKLGYDPQRDLAPVTSAVLSVNVLVVHPSVPAHTVKELIALARRRPNELAYGTSGTGGAGHLAGALFRQLTKTQLLHVPYKGGGPAMIDLVAGQTQIGFASQPSSAAFIKEGRLRALAVTTAQRSKLLPQLPTLAEAGVPGYESHAWYGFVVPAKTPQPLIARLNQELVRILHSSDINQAMHAQGLEVWTMTPDAFGAYIRSEAEKWTRVIKAAGLNET
jgi:tripartite-type tricarboxylate transporter receptor subunit TctC